jgi:hypothetical protein
MLTLTGTIRAVAMLGGGFNKKTGQVVPERPVVQVEGLDSRGLVQVYTLTVPSLSKYEGLVGQTITVPVRAWAVGAPVNLSFEDLK